MAAEPRNCEEKEEGQATEPDRQHIFHFYPTTPMKRIPPVIIIIALSIRPLMAIAIMARQPLVGPLFHYGATPPLPQVNPGEPQWNGVYHGGGGAFSIDPALRAVLL